MSARRIIFTILIVLNCCLIFYFSNQVADNSKSQSSRVVEFISNIIPTIKNMDEQEKTTLKEEVLTPIVRKTAHFSLYALLGFNTVGLATSFENIDTKKKLLFSLLFCIFYATTDEIHQSFIPGRSCELRDILIDTLGSLTGIAIIIGGIKLWRKK